jgi:hypothetical protein
VGVKKKASTYDCKKIMNGWQISTAKPEMDPSARSSDIQDSDSQDSDI